MDCNLLIFESDSTIRYDMEERACGTFLFITFILFLRRSKDAERDALYESDPVP